MIMRLQFGLEGLSGTLRMKCSAVSWPVGALQGVMQVV